MISARTCMYLTMKTIPGSDRASHCSRTQYFFVHHHVTRRCTLLWQQSTVHYWSKYTNIGLVIGQLWRVEASKEVDDNLLQLCLRLVRDLGLRADCVKNILVGASDMCDKLPLELSDERRIHFVKMATHTSIDDCHLVLDGHGHCNTTTFTKACVPLQICFFYRFLVTQTSLQNIVKVIFYYLGLFCCLNTNMLQACKIYFIETLI